MKGGEAIDQITWAAVECVEAAVDGPPAARPWRPPSSPQQCRKLETSCTQVTHTRIPHSHLTL